MIYIINGLKRSISIKKKSNYNMPYLLLKAIMGNQHSIVKIFCGEAEHINRVYKTF